MPNTKSQQATDNKNVSEKTNRISLSLPKGMREDIGFFIKASGKYRNKNTGKGTVNQFIRDAIMEKMIQDPDIFHKLRNERNWFEWYNYKASEEEKALTDKVHELSDAYFSDFRFEPQTVIEEFIAAKAEYDGEWIYGQCEIFSVNNGLL